MGPSHRVDWAERENKDGRISPFLVAVINHHDQSNLEKKEFIWTYGFRGLESMIE